MNLNIVPHNEICFIDLLKTTVKNTQWKQGSVVSEFLAALKELVG